MAIDNLTSIYAQDKVDMAVIDESIRKSAVWNTGLVYIDGKLNELVAAGEGRKISRIGWGDISDPLLTGNAAQATTHNPGYPDDSNTALIPNANATYMYDAVRCMANWSMAQKEIIKAVSYVQDPVGALNGRVSDFWARYFDMYTTSMLAGIFAENLAGTGDMISGDGTAPADENVIIDGFDTMGDAAQLGSGIMICHSKVATVLRKLQLIDSIPSAENTAINFEYFQGVRMLVSDQVPNSGGKAITILAKPGVVAFGNSDNGIIPSEVWRDPLTGVGSGEEHLITRQNFSAHVDGYTWNDTTVSGSVASGSIPGLSSGDALWPCPTDVALAANWTRKLARKKINLAFVRTSELAGGITS
jgi:hypothetical protein